MMNNMSQVNLLQSLSNGNKLTFVEVLRFLENQDLESLASALKTIREESAGLHLILTILHYRKYLDFDHCSNLTWGFQEDQCLALARGYGDNITLSPNLEFSDLEIQITNLKVSLGECLCKMIPEEDSHAIIEDLFESLKEGPLITPYLRRECVGLNANTPVQFYLADILTRDEPRDEQDCMYSSLKEYITGSAHQLEQSTLNYKTNLKLLRFQGQITREYTPCSSQLLNLINLVLTAFDIHLQAVYRMLKSEQQPIERLAYMLSHYINYRQTVLAMDEKIGFVFVFFTYVFDKAFKQMSMLPTFSIVQVLLKKWYNKMKEFHEYNTYVISYLITKQREDVIQNLIKRQENELCVDRGTESKHNMTQTFSNSLFKRLKQTKGDIYCAVNKISDAARHIIRQYTEYLIDISTNQVTVHYNNHTEQQIGFVYRQAEKTILRDNAEFYDKLCSDYRYLPTCKYLMEQDIKELGRLVKPLTLKKIVTAANGLLNQMKQLIPITDIQVTKRQFYQTYVKSWTDIQFNFTKSNRLIESMLQNLKIPPYVDKDYRDMYDITIKIDIQKLQQLFEELEDQPNMSEIESYRSEGGSVGDAMEVQEMQEIGEQQRDEEEIELETDASGEIPSGKRPKIWNTDHLYSKQLKQE